MSEGENCVLLVFVYLGDKILVSGFVRLGRSGIRLHQELRCCVLSECLNIFVGDNILSGSLPQQGLTH